jgi:hypothetical protein
MGYAGANQHCSDGKIGVFIAGDPHIQFISVRLESG